MYSAVNKPQAFFDLDGTLVDITDRWYALHRDVALLYKLPVLKREEYVNQKCEGTPEALIMKAVSTDSNMIEKYCAERLKHIEEPEYLVHDKLYAETLAVLDAWKKRYMLVLVTARHNNNALAKELTRLGIADYFSSILLTQGESKRAALSEVGSTYIVGAPFISDSHEDYRIGLELGMYPIAVSYGCRSKEFLLSKGIENTVSSPQELIPLAADMYGTKK